MIPANHIKPLKKCEEETQAPILVPETVQRQLHLFVSHLISSADVTTAEPKPIPGGVSPFGILIHHFPLPPPGPPLSQLTEPSEITDFNGFIGDTRIRGAGTGNGVPHAFQTDMGFMQGEYIGEASRHHHGTFVFI